MKKLNIINSVYGDATGGRWQAMLNMSDALTAQGHEVMHVVGADNAHLSVGERPMHQLKNSGFYDVIAAYKLNKWLKKQNVDVVIAHSGRAVCLFKNAMNFGGVKVPVIAVNHSHNVKRTVRADGFIHITPHVGELVAIASQKRRVNLQSKKQAIISNLVHLPEMVAVSSTFHQPVTLGVMTRLVDYKGTHTLIDALALLRQRKYKVRLLVAGEGEEKENLIAQTQRLALTDQVSFLGWVKGDQKTQFYNDVDIVAVPTLNDTQPLAILDAFAWAKPVVASDHISVLQICQHEVNALLSACEDAEQLAENIIRLIDDQAFARGIAQQGYADAQHKYAFAQVSEQLNQFLLAVCE